MKIKKTLVAFAALLFSLFLIQPVAAKTKTVEVENNYTITSGERGENQQSEDVKETVKVPVNPKKVVVYDMGALDTVTALGAQNNVVGIPKAENAIRMLGGDLQKVYKAKKYQDVGTLFEPNFETIASIQPDLILLGARMTSKENIEKLKEAAPKAALVYAAVDSSKAFTEGVQERVTTFGKIFNKTKKAKEYNQKITKAITKLKSTISDKGNPTGLFVMANSGELLSQSPQGRFGWVFTEAGFKAVNSDESASTHGSQVSYEYLSEKNPQYLFVLDRGATIGQEASAETFLKNDVIKDTDAIKNDHVLQVNGKDWYINSGGARVTLRMIKEVQGLIDK